MTASRQSTEKLQKLMGQLLTALPANELQKLQTQYDELETRATAEEMNRMEKLLHSVVSVENIERLSSVRLQKLMGQLLAVLPATELQKLQTQFDELETRATAEEMNRMEKLLHSVVSVGNLQKAVGKGASV